MRTRSRSTTRSARPRGARERLSRPGGILLLTGPPGVGKTTVIRAAAEALSPYRRGGFYTEEIRVRGERRGFALVTFDGRRARIADVARPGAPRVGKYGVDVEIIEKMSRAALAVDGTTDLYLVDEVGKMECLSEAFVAGMRTLLDSQVPVVASVSQRGGGFMEEVRRRRDAELWEIDRSTRDELPVKIVAWAQRRLRS